MLFYIFARFMTLNSVSPELTLAVVRILCVMTQSPDMQNEIIGILSSKKVASGFRNLLIVFSDFCLRQLFLVRILQNK